MAEAPCCPPETITTLLTGYSPIHNEELKRGSVDEKVLLKCDFIIHWWKFFERLTAGIKY